MSAKTTKSEMWVKGSRIVPAGQEFVINSPIGYSYKDLVRIQADVNHQVGEWFENNNIWPPIPH